MEAKWYKPTRKPAEYRSLECECELTGPDDLVILTYSHERGFFEPITNRLAEPVVGKVLRWRYRQFSSDVRL